jgi:hypothetical protein
MSARPDLCGGQPARAVPTAITSLAPRFSWYTLSGTRTCKKAPNFAWEPDRGKVPRYHHL